MPRAIQKEKSLKRYAGQWKINLIEETHPEWLPIHPETGEFLPFEKHAFTQTLPPLDRLAKLTFSYTARGRG